MNKEIYKLLGSAGFRENETDIYTTLMQLEKATILEIAEKSGVKRPTVYERLPVLVKKGYVTEVFEGKKTYYIAKNPNQILRRLREKAQSFEEAMPELSAIYNSVENKPKVTYFSGEEELQRMYEDTLTGGTDILHLTAIEGLYGVLDKDWADDYAAKRVSLGIKTRVIAVDSSEARSWKANAEKELREIKIIKKAGENFSADMQICGDKVIIATQKKGELFGLIIEDDYIASLQRMAFELLWKNL